MCVFVSPLEYRRIPTHAVNAIHFFTGTPAVLSPELSFKYRNAITTVVADADCVPRMSGQTLVNAWHRIISHDHGDDNITKAIINN